MSMSLEVTKYIEGYPGDIQEKMQVLRGLIHEIIPNIQEKISWGMPTFYTSENLFHFAGNKNHLGIYPGANGIEFIIPDLKDFKYSKGGFQIPYSKPLPLDVLRKLLEFKKMSSGS